MTSSTKWKVRGIDMNDVTTYFMLVGSTNVRPVLTKWAASHQGRKGGIAHKTIQKSIENKCLS